jgi:hypothetical protein
MIEPAQAMPLLVEACPSFGEEWQQHLQEHGNELLYIAAGTFADHLWTLFENGDLSSFPAVAAAIEHLHVEGSPWVREFATIGLLEGIQNVWLNKKADPDGFARFLHPESHRWWRGLDKFWSGDAPFVAGD